MPSLFWIGFAGAALAGGFAALQAARVFRFPEGTDRMKRIAAAIRVGADAYLRKQFSTVLVAFFAVFAVLLAVAF